MMCLDLVMTYTADIYDKSWKVVETINLSDKVFWKEGVSLSLMHEYYLLQMANARNPIAHTKTRWEVSGSGKKLYKQKGTGSARVGDKRSPLRKKGWVVFGPKNNRNYSKTMPKKARKLALYGMLSLKAKSKDIIGFTGFDYKSPKTKEAANFLKKISIDGKKVLIVVGDKNETITKSFKNIDRVKYIYLNYLNPFDLMYHDKLLFTKEALDKLNTTS